MYIVVDSGGNRLCLDNVLRGFAHFGTYSWCVKEYKSLAWAKKRVDRLNKFGFGAKVIEFGEGTYIDASGCVWNEFCHPVHICRLTESTHIIPGITVHD